MTSAAPSTFDSKTLEQAAEWFALLESEQVNEPQRAQWQAWLDANEQHRKAWARVEQVNQCFNGLPAEAASRTLRQTTFSRRQLIKNFIILLIAGGALQQAARWQNVGASYKTRRGELAQYTLDDGTQLWLNTATVVDINFSATQRSIELREGEILVDTGADRRPFYITTAHGRLQALGTRFVVRDYDEQITLAVEEGSVAVQPLNAKPVVVKPHFEVSFSADRVQPEQALQKNSVSWIRRVIFADGMRLDDFIDELNRYYAGHINVSEDVADLTLLGVYPVEDVDRVLNAIQQSHAVSINRTLPWWRSIQSDK